MNKLFFKYLLSFISCLFIANSCTNDDQLIEVQTKNNEVKNKFSVFYKNNNTQAKGGDLSINYPKGFAILIQKYDSVHQTNLSGLVNTSNEVVWDKNLRQNFIKNVSEPYVETRIFSQTILNNKGDISVIFPKILNNIVIDLIVAELHDEETQVHFYILDKNSTLYHSSVNLFQERFENTFLKKNAKSANGGFECGYGNLPSCNLDGPIIIGGGGGPGFCCWGNTGGEIGGGGCSKYDMCMPDNDGGGGGSPNSNETPCEKAMKENNKNKEILNNNDIKNNVKNITSSIETNKEEKGFSFGVKNNGSYITLPVQTGTSSHVNLPVTSPSGADYTITGSAHTHPSDGFDSFSPADFYGFANSYTANNSFRTIFVYGPNGVVYSLTITNPDQFKNFMNNYPKSEYFDTNTNGWKDNSSIEKDFKNAFKDFYFNQKLSDNLAYALANAYALAKHNAGIAINKQDANGNFNTLFVNEKDSNYNQTTNCNL